MRALLLCLLPAIALSSCDAYDRDIGPAPYLCGPSEPRCPDDYTCTLDQSSGLEVCLGEDGNPNAFDCIDDTASEPNDTVETATPTPLDAMKTSTYNGAICPTGDKDIYAITFSAANQNLEVVVEFETDGAVLTASILNRAGAPIAIGVPVSGTTTNRAYFEDVPIGMYYAQVAGPSGGALPVNNYQLTLTLSGP